MIYVLVVDDHVLVRTGLARLLDDVRGIKVIAQASSGEEALTKIRKPRPDVVLMDLGMPGIGGLEASRKILAQDSDIRIIALTAHTEEPYPTRFLEIGASGYITKGCAADELIDAVKQVHAGEKFVGNDIARQMALAKAPGGLYAVFDKLSRREIEVMQLVTKGHTVQEISDHLCLSPKTINTYRYRLYDKLAVENDVELTHLAMRHGFVDSPV